MLRPAPLRSLTLKADGELYRLAQAGHLECGGIRWQLYRLAHLINALLAVHHFPVEVSDDLRRQISSSGHPARDSWEFIKGTGAPSALLQHFAQYFGGILVYIPPPGSFSEILTSITFNSSFSLSVIISSPPLDLIYGTYDVLES